MRKSGSFPVPWVLAGSALAVVCAVSSSVGLPQNESAGVRGGNHQPHDHYAALAKVPDRPRAKLNPLANDPEAVTTGGKLFEQHCSECHGMKAEGTKRAPSLLNEHVHQATPGTLFWILSNGVVRRGMPDWSKLPEPQRWQLVSFVKSLTVSPPKALEK